MGPGMINSPLVQGIYEGDVTYGDLRKHGDFGLGTFNLLRHFD